VREAEFDKKQEDESTLIATAPPAVAASGFSFLMDWWFHVFH
jgi:hypothetical protein